MKDDVDEIEIRGTDSRDSSVQEKNVTFICHTRDPNYTLIAYSCRNPSKAHVPTTIYSVCTLLTFTGQTMGQTKSDEHTISLV